MESCGAARLLAKPHRRDEWHRRTARRVRTPRRPGPKPRNDRLAVRSVGVKVAYLVPDIGPNPFGVVLDVGEQPLEVPAADGAELAQVADEWFSTGGIWNQLRQCF